MLVRDFANNLGPPHLEWDDAKPEMEMLTKSSEWFKIADRSGVVMRLLSIGQILVRSRAVALFREGMANRQLDHSKC